MHNPVNNTYLALTIGPVVKTLLQARKTRELWAASFLLSSLMKYLVKNLDPSGKKVLIPRIPQELENQKLYGAGIYPDRLFMQADHLLRDNNVETVKGIEAAISRSLEDLAKDCLLAKEAEDEQEVSNAVEFWRAFFRIRYQLLELPDISGGKLSLELTPYLTAQEMEDTCLTQEPERDYLLHLFEIERLYHCPLIKGLKGTNRGVYDSIMGPSSHIPSTSEIAALELYTNTAVQDIAAELDREKDEAHEEFYARIEAEERIKNLLRPRHKYFCIVQADGDNIGAAIQQLSGPNDYTDFSATLARFGAEGADIINRYGGKPIYIGGDDLLFLAPVYTSKGSILDLLQELDRIFPGEALHPSASLSFGVNIVYYKFPLFEAIGDAYHILDKAKSFKDGAKDSISFQFTKHSGSAFYGVFSKEMLSKIISAIAVFEQYAPEGRTGVISALIYKLFTLEQLFQSITAQVRGEKNADVREILTQRFTETLDHFFNEWENEKGFEKQKETITDLLMAAYAETTEEDSWIALFYAVLRLIQFTISPSESIVYDTEDQTAAA